MDIAVNDLVYKYDPDDNYVQTYWTKGDALDAVDRWNRGE